MKTPLKITLFLLFAAALASTSGCCSRLRPGGLFPQREKEDDVRLDDQIERVVSQNGEFETILQIGGKARRITPSCDSKRVLIERETFLNDKRTLDVNLDASKNSTEREDALNVELWNLEFSTATQEEFKANEYILTLQKSNCASFSAQGDRIFWLEREQVHDESEGTENANSFFSAAAPSFELRNVVLTKELGLSSYERPNETDVTQTTPEPIVKHLKTNDAIKNASRLRLSSRARWLICRASHDAFGSDKSESAQTSISEEKPNDFLYDLPSWLLIYVPNGKRVVRFPETIKMTFDSSTSDETIEGRIVDVLDVSDEGDLVATLAEELPQETQNDEKKEPVANGTLKQAQNWNPRYKIVVWDLEVARTVDLEKKRSPIYALEVSQIPIKSPITSDDCRFSNDGKILAAKVEPRSISVWQAANGRLKGEFWEDDGFIRDFALASNGMRLVAGVGDKEGEALLWDVRTGALQKDARFPQTRSIDAVTFFNSDKQVLFIDSDGVVKSWDVDVAPSSER